MGSSRRDEERRLGLNRSELSDLKRRHRAETQDPTVTSMESKLEKTTQGSVLGGLIQWEDDIEVGITFEKDCQGSTETITARKTRKGTRMPLAAPIGLLLMFYGGYLTFGGPCTILMIVVWCVLAFVMLAAIMMMSMGDGQFGFGTSLFICSIAIFAYFYHLEVNKQPGPSHAQDVPGFSYAQNQAVKHLSGLDPDKLSAKQKRIYKSLLGDDWTKYTRKQ